MRIAVLDISDELIAREVLELQRRAYRVEAALIGSNDIPPLRESVHELQVCGETFLGVFMEGGLVGCVSWKLKNETIDLQSAEQQRWP